MDMEKKNKNKPADSFDDFLTHVDLFGSGNEEKAFMDSIGHDFPGEEPSLNLGERVRQVREKRGLSLQDISQRTDIAVDLLSRIEAGEVAPPLGTIVKLAKSLEMKLGYFISGEGSKPYTIVRRTDRKVISRYDSKKGERYGYEYWSLAPRKKDRHMEPFLVTLVPSETEEERSTHDGQEFIFVLQGKIEVRLQEEIHIIEPGDAIYYDSTVPHLVKCYGGDLARILAVLYIEK
jgi:transcriptional regulator with XRE-family HTH domain